MITEKELTEELFKIHTHAELCDQEEIVYREKDILNLIKSLWPIWDDTKAPERIHEPSVIYEISK